MSFTGNTQAGTLVASGTTVTGLMTKYGITPETIGIFATLCGILLTIIMIYGHIRRIRNESAERKEKEIIARLEAERAQLELDELRRRVSNPAQ
ncbi:hypothetical protein M12a_00022 [Klebsiella phage VLCpiM12a]|jgi:hypothetical protein|uniref:Holin n=4 Tax=Jameshumphriesvirinae TaxID=3152215 RepID=A0A291LBR7_9CAUD|nr:hypothetical protein [Klebsiella pneumoniae]YP_009615323.1 hypothetical protein FDI70_gp52 [Klebsiella phage vB_KpnM_KpV79]YP_010683830.1 hypothetical protein PQZ58_gp22 [Klebsiella phage VLCpiM12a]YP_010684731.1 microfibrillar-associated 1 family protein [Klebsiella phage 1611E-K2-1]ATI16505.1 hypothetical protein kpv79_52 [Klebsiella phage vB_KpnM_KpV79]RZM50414.1 hypothetical protein C1455_03405 [Klebsiella pneumoniae]UVX31533.1 hypothetical protein M12a_00022 [Klebsiella phage VLCpiM12